MHIEFTNRTALVTGAAHGFGRAIALALAERGANVWACDIVANEIRETGDLLHKRGGRNETRVVDVTQRTDVNRFVADAFAATGRVDILVNDAGGVLGQVGQPLEAVTPVQWQSIFDVNVTGAFTMCQAAAPHMKSARYGRIVNISSGAGLRVSLTGIQAYASAKAAQIGLTRQLAHELGPWNITVNNIAPGFVRSNPTTEKQWQSYSEQRQRAIIDGIATKRLGAPEDIVYGVLFFASEFAGWITGQVLSVDGGRS